MEDKNDEDEDFFEVSHTVFEDRDALLDHVPDKLIARDDQVKKLKQLLKPAFLNSKPSNAIIFGKSGTGKTVTIKYMIEKLKKQLEEYPDINIIPALINCRKTNTSTDILYNLIYTIDSSIDHPRNGVSKSQHYETLINLLKIKRTSLIVIFDEIDYLEDEGIIYNLSREDFEDIYDKLFISMVGITNDYSFFGKIGPGVKSSFGNESLEFPGYDSQELVNILNERSSIAFKDGCLDEGTIPYCAALTASDKKDARYSLEILKTAGDIADFENSDIITQEHVLDAYKKLNQNKKIQAAKSLSLKQGFVLFVILKSYINNEKTYSGNIINMYKKYGKKLDMSIPSNNRISEYITELDKIGLITANDRGGRGNSRVLEPTEDPYVLFDAIKEANPIFKDLYL